MKVSDVYRPPSEKICAEDLNGHDVTLTIKDVEQVKFADGLKIVVHFYKTDRSLVLNRTNADTIVSILGDDTDFWVGKAITVFPDKTMFAGKYVPCIRIRHHNQANMGIAANNPMEASKSNGNDALPYSQQDRAPDFVGDDDVPF